MGRRELYKNENILTGKPAHLGGKLLSSKYSNPRNTPGIPVVKIFAFLDLGQN